MKSQELKRKEAIERQYYHDKLTLGQKLLAAPENGKEAKKLQKLIDKHGEKTYYPTGDIGNYKEEDQAAVRMKRKTQPNYETL